MIVSICDNESFLLLFELPLIVRRRIRLHPTPLKRGCPAKLVRIVYAILTAPNSPALALMSSINLNVVVIVILFLELIQYYFLPWSVIASIVQQHSASIGTLFVCFSAAFKMTSIIPKFAASLWISAINNFMFNDCK